MYTYHGPDRDSSVPFLEQHDIVLTTYSILTGDRSLRNGLLKVMLCALCIAQACWRNPGAALRLLLLL